MTFRLWQALTLAMGLMAATPASGVACSCEIAGPPCEAAWKSDAVFAGTVRSVVEIDHDAYERPYGSRLVTVDVERAFANAATGPLELITGRGGGDCGYQFAVGQRYLIYATKTPTGHWHASTCSRTRPIEKAQEDLQ